MLYYILLKCATRKQVNFGKREAEMHKAKRRYLKAQILLVGPPMLTTSKGFSSGANSSFHAEAALRRAIESA